MCFFGPCGLTRRVHPPCREARELVSELEFVWDQMKNNPSSPPEEGSLPLQRLDGLQPAGQISSYPSFAGGGRGLGAAMARPVQARGGGLVPTSSSPAEGNNEDTENEEYVNAVEGYEEDGDAAYAQNSPVRVTATAAAAAAAAERAEAGDVNWRRRVEEVLVRLTDEVIALREDLDPRGLLVREKRARLGKRNWVWGWAVWFVWAALKHVAVDAVLVGLLLLWRRRRRMSVGVAGPRGDMSGLAVK